jgi:hypothetical protein
MAGWQAIVDGDGAAEAKKTIEDLVARGALMGARPDIQQVGGKTIVIGDRKRWDGASEARLDATDIVASSDGAAQRITDKCRCGCFAALPFGTCLRFAPARRHSVLVI